MTEDDERAAFRALRTRFAQDRWLDDDVSCLGDLIWDAVIERNGDWLVFSPDRTGDPKWSHGSNTFYGNLGEWATEGRVDVVGEDGWRWSYVYADGGVAQEGINGWDGTESPHP